jgi:hypothetical protein
VRELIEERRKSQARRVARRSKRPLPSEKVDLLMVCRGRFEEVKKEVVEGRGRKET